MSTKYSVHAYQWRHGERRCTRTVTLDTEAEAVELARSLRTEPDSWTATPCLVRAAGWLEPLPGWGGHHRFPSNARRYGCAYCGCGS